MHIPDGFLSTPVWTALDLVAAPAVALAVRRAQKGFDEARIPLLGVTGAFVFAAQMINFPVGVGTSGHLIGGALLAYTLGPAAASVVLTAILAIQALVFQDGGVLALGANIINMALLGTLAAWLPYRYWAGRRPKAAVLAGGALSVLVSATLALSELLLSGVRMPGPVLGLSLGLFAVSAVLEGLITMAVLQALEALHGDFIRQPSGRGSWAVGALATAATVLAVAGVLFASTHPDGIQKLALASGIAGQAHGMVTTPFAGYEASFLENGWLRKAAAGMTGLVLIYGVCVLLGRLAARNRSA